MRVPVTGATGFIGQAAISVLRREGHSVVGWVRSEMRARGRLDAEVELVESAGGLDALVKAIEGCDAIVNLAGEPILGGRWTEARRRVLRESRVGVTEQLVQAIGLAERGPHVLVSGSAVGYCGDRGDEALEEDSRPADDFLAQLCVDWEAAATAAERWGVRVVRLRAGVVLGRGGGALAQMLPPFRFGVGGPVGSGRQYMPWIHLDDLAAIVAAAIADARYRGPVNGVVPEQVRSREFARALGRALRRPALLPTPALALRLLFGEASAVLLASQRVEPRVLSGLGYPFMFPTLDAALADIVGGSRAVGAPRAGTAGGA